MINPFKRRKNQKGNALVYVLISIALLGALSASLMESSGDQVSSQRMTETISALKSQADFISATIHECVLNYPSGDTGYSGPAMLPYPLNADNAYLLSPAGSSVVRSIRCPGNPGNSNDHAAIFGGSSGRAAPEAPKAFNQWVYYNSADGVFIMTATSLKDSYVSTALNKLKSLYSKCEADVINATSGTKNITTDGWQCLNGLYCFRVWLRSKPTSMFPDEAGCP